MGIEKFESSVVKRINPFLVRMATERLFRCNECRSRDIEIIDNETCVCKNCGSDEIGICCKDKRDG